MPPEIIFAAAFTIPLISFGETNIASPRISLALQKRLASITVGTPIAITGAPTVFLVIEPR